MPTKSQYFNNYYNEAEQKLLDSLIVEAIQIYGIDCWYLPRKLKNFDKIYETDDQSSYDAAFKVELYIEDVDGFGSSGNIMEKFGLEIREQITFTMALSIFQARIGLYTKQPRPNEGDIIFFPLNKKPLQIKFVNNKEFFFQFGALQTYQLVCELFEYSNETFDTGIPEIDAIQQDLSLNVLDRAIVDPQGRYLLDPQRQYLLDTDYSEIDPIDDNLEIDREIEPIINWDETNPFGTL